MSRKLAAFLFVAFVIAVSLLVPLMAFAAEVTAVGDKAVIVPYGDWIVGAGQTASAILVPTLVTVLTGAIYSVAPWAKLFLSSSLVERVVRNAVDYALNAVAGAVKDKTLDVPTGSKVIAVAVQRAVDQAPKWLVTQAGGAQGIAEKVFRSLHLPEAANRENTLAPVLTKIAGTK